MPNPFRHCIALVIVLLLLSVPLRAAVAQGDYVFSGKGAMLLNFDSAGAFTGVAAFPRFGVVNMSGALAGASGAYELRDRISGELLDSGALASSATARGVRLVVGSEPGMGFIGTPRISGSAAPAGLFSAPFPPVNVLYQCVPSADPHLVTLQGDQDFFLNLNQALGGQFIFDQKGRGFGTVYENSDPAGIPHWATIKFKSGALALRVYIGMTFGKSRAIRLAAVTSGGKYDGVYTALVTPDNCVAQTFKVTVKDDVVSGTNTTTGTLGGFVDFSGHITFTTQRLTISDTTCQQAGAHSGAVAFAGDLSNAAFPRVMEGTFSGAGTLGTFVLNQPAGPTGATATSATPRPEIWSGTLTGTHVSNICNGGKWNESYTLRLTFPSDAISALRGQNEILSGTGTISGSETVATQPPALLECTYLESTLAETAVRIVFAGNLVPNGSVVDIQSDTVLFPSTVHFTSGSQPDQGENRAAFRLHVKHINATTLKGEWPFGTFILKKQ